MCYAGCRNEPNVHLSEQLDNNERWHGAELKVTILGNWQYYRAKIIKCAIPGSLTTSPAQCQAILQLITALNQLLRARRYLRQIAVITPYARFTFSYIAEDEKNNVKINFTRRTDKMPAPPKVHHPSRTLQTKYFLLLPLSSSSAFTAFMGS